MTAPIVEFLAHEADECVRAQLFTVIDELTDGQRYFTYNTFNVLLDAATTTVTIEDELDATRQSKVSFDEFRARLAKDGR